MDFVRVPTIRFLEAMEWLWDRDAFDPDSQDYYARLIAYCRAYPDGVVKLIGMSSGAARFGFNIMPGLNDSDRMLFKLTFAI